jgi:dephospho-CoA kinase
MTQEEAQKRISAQMSLADKVKRSHFVIDNSESFERLPERVQCVVTRIHTMMT